MKLNAVCFLISIWVFTTANADETSKPESSDLSLVKMSERFAQLALDCVHTEYPNSIKHMLVGPQDVKAPSQMYPAFYGCYDWHSSVHGHWLLTRIAHLYPNHPKFKSIIASLDKSFTDENIKGELAYFNRANTGTSFERPYGLAWFLLLSTELREWDTPKAKQWLTTLEPLEAKIVANISDWLGKLAYPIRVGEHSQTAFAFGLMLDWGRAAGNKEFTSLLERSIIRLYRKDTSCPLAYEPSGQDFLSPCLAEADLMRRVLSPELFSSWLREFLPNIPTSPTQTWIAVASVVDKSDGKLAHLDGLNLSRAWMLEGIAGSLSHNDPRKKALLSAARAHEQAGIHAVIEDMHYMGSHWLGSFATYLVTERGLN